MTPRAAPTLPRATAPRLPQLPPRLPLRRPPPIPRRRRPRATRRRPPRRPGRRSRRPPPRRRRRSSRRASRPRPSRRGGEGGGRQAPEAPRTPRRPASRSDPDAELPSSTDLPAGGPRCRPALARGGGRRGRPGRRPARGAPLPRPTQRRAAAAPPARRRGRRRWPSTPRRSTRRSSASTARAAALDAGGQGPAATTRRCEFDATGSSDLKAGKIDPRVVARARGSSPRSTRSPSSVHRDRPRAAPPAATSPTTRTAAASTSRSIDGEIVNPGSTAARDLATEIAELSGPTYRPTEIGSPFAIGRARLLHRRRATRTTCTSAFEEEIAATGCLPPTSRRARARQPPRWRPRPPPRLRWRPVLPRPAAAASPAPTPAEAEAGRVED